MNNQSDLFYGSICVSDLLEQANKKHSGFVKGQNGKIYAAVNIWKNQEPDKFGNIISIQLQSTKERKDVEGKIYVGNAKKAEAAYKPIQDNDVNKLEIKADIPTNTPRTNYSTAGVQESDISGKMDDLPF
jgi:hypothetical protein